MVHSERGCHRVGATMHMAAVADRVLGSTQFCTFTADLDQLVKWFVECGVETVVMNQQASIDSDL
jgi:hypothetical protein